MALKSLIKKPHLVVPAKEQKGRRDITQIILEMQGPGVCPPASSCLSWDHSQGQHSLQKPPGDPRSSHSHGVLLAREVVATGDEVEERVHMFKDI